MVFNAADYEKLVRFLDARYRWIENKVLSGEEITFDPDYYPYSWTQKINAFKKSVEEVGLSFDDYRHFMPRRYRIWMRYQDGLKFLLNKTH